jgi:nucleoside-diphosphate-sugar epimerase
VPAEAELLEGDVRDLEAVRGACDGVDVVFHLAGLDSVSRSLEDPLLTHSCNVDGTVNVLLAAEEEGVRRVVNSSSASVYGDVKDAVNHEDAPKNPLSPLAVSKLATEEYCRTWSRLRGLPCVSLRLFNVFGPGQAIQSKYAPVIPSFISAIAQIRPPELHWDGEQARDFIYVEDVVEAYVLAAAADARVDGTAINIGSGASKTISEVLQSICNSMDRWMDALKRVERSGDVRRTQADISKARDLLGWAPSTEWNIALQETIDFYLKHHAETAEQREGQERFL